MHHLASFNTDREYMMINLINSKKLILMAMCAGLLFLSTYADSEPIHDAAKVGSLGEIRRLIEAGADLNAKTEEGRTPLMFAAGNGHVEALRVLLQAGADVNLGCQDGFTALMDASIGGHQEVVQLLIEYGADVDAQQKDGITALMLASAMGHPEVTKLLTAEGANVHAKTKDGQTSLMIASQGGHIEVASLLIQEGADVEARTTAGYTAILYAVQRGHTEIAQLLEKSRASGGKAYVAKEAEKIPSGVTYIRTTDERNKNASEYLLEVFFKTDSNVFLPKVILCGPFLWQELITNMGFDKSAGIPWLFRISTEAGFKELEGRGIRWQDQTKKLQLILKAIFQKSNISVTRKLTENEIALYWRMISYDIEEPVFIIESPGFLLLVDIDQEGVFFVDNYYRPLGK